MKKVWEQIENKNNYAKIYIFFFLFLVSNYKFLVGLDWIGGSETVVREGGGSECSVVW